MKLFVWADPYKIPFGSAMVFAIAETEDEARAVANGAPRYSFGQYRNHAEAGRAALGKPTRIVDLPCAEWHEWEE